MIWLEIWLIMISVICIIYFYLLNGYIVLKGENLIIKAVKNNLNWISYLSYVIILYNLIDDLKLKEKYVLLPYVFVFFSSVIFSYVEYGRIPYAFQNLHFAGGFPYYRIRMLTTEASYTASIIMISFVLTLKYLLDVIKSRMLIFLSFACFVYLCIISSSKTLLFLCSAFALLYFFRLEKSLGYNIVKILILVIFLIVMQKNILPKFGRLISADVENYTSTFTRTYTIIIAFVHSCVYFIGVGNSLYLSTFVNMISNNLNKYIILCNAIGIKFMKKNTIEIVDRYINSNNDFGLSVKSGIFEYGLYWGIIGNIFFIKLLYTLYKNIKEERILKIGFIICILSQLFAGFTFDFWAYMVIVMYYGNKKYVI